jgi:hypothetical protein
MLLIVVIVMRIKIYIENAETAKRLKQNALKHAEEEAQGVWNEKSLLQKGITVTCTILDALVGKKPP